MPSLIEETRTKYQIVKDYEKRNGFPNIRGPIWEQNMAVMLYGLNLGTAEDMLRYIDRTFLYSINFPPEYAYRTNGVWEDTTPDTSAQVRELQIQWLLERISVGSFKDSEYGEPQNKINGYSGNFLRTVAIASRANRSPALCLMDNGFIELGGGAGHQARTFLLKGVTKYVIIDLPETLNYSYTHLRLCFPDRKLVYVTTETEIDQEADVLFVPTCFAKWLKGRSYDLFINTASLGEMPNNIQRMWMEFVRNDLKVTYLYTLNRFLNVILPQWRSDRWNHNECQQHYGSEMKVLTWELEPFFTRCPYIDTLHSRYLEVMGELHPSRPPANGVALYQEAVKEDWYRLQGMYSEGIMTARHNIFVNDCKESGTLFKLWESIRQRPTQENVTAMIKWMYMKCNSHAYGQSGLEFEELRYYLNLSATFIGPLR